jgi:hypothetical protein
MGNGELGYSRGTDFVLVVLVGEKEKKSSTTFMVWVRHDLGLKTKSKWG